MYAGRACIALIAALAFALGFAACGGDGEKEAPTGTPAATVATEAAEPTPLGTVEASGDIVTESMEFTDFTTVEVGNSFSVEITQSDSFTVFIRIDRGIRDLLDVSQDGDTLRIGLTEPDGFTDAVMEALVAMPDLDALVLSGASAANVSGFQSTEPLDVVVSGASSLQGSLEAGSITFDVSGACSVALRGSAGQLSIAASGSSTLDLTGLTTDTADVTLSGASEATVNVEDRIDTIDLSGTSRLLYLGDPDLGDVSTTGASTVEQVEN